MKHITIQTFVFIAGLTVCNLAIAGGRGSITTSTPIIVKTSVSAQDKTLIITGHHFGTTTPIVMLADEPLDVKHFSEQEVVANLPHGLLPATYAVTVTSSGRQRASSNPFSATLATDVKTAR